jgi:hypothetical protein
MKTQSFGSLQRLVYALLAFFASMSLQAAERYYTYITKDKDTLIGLSARLLKQPDQWPQIQSLNRIKDPRGMPVGTRLQIPVSQLRIANAPADVTAITGKATSGGKQLVVGDKIAPGAEIETAADGYVTLKLVDGTEVLVQASSKLALANSQKGEDVGVFDLLLKLVFGRVETRAAKKTAADRLEISTPTATMGVRGTVFRVAALDAKASTSEVLEGLVGATSLDAQAQVAVNAGFGTKVEEGKAPSPPIQLLDAPKLEIVPALFERVVLRFNVTAVAKAQRYRAQISRDEAFKEIAAESVSDSTEFKFPALPDGRYFLKARAIDSLGLEGNDAVRVINVKARPEAPLVVGPARNGKLSVGEGSLDWTQSVDAAAYRLQVATDAQFANVVVNETRLSGNRFSTNALPIGQYHWRIGSVRTVTGKDDVGPWGDASTFSVRPLPQLPPPSLEGKSLSLALAGEPGQKFEIQIASDSEFRKIVSTQVAESANAKVDLPTIGVYFVRFRSIDPDGFKSPYSGAQRVEVYGKPWWLL